MTDRNEDAAIIAATRRWVETVVVELRR